MLAVTARLDAAMRARPERRAATGAGGTPCSPHSARKADTALSPPARNRAMLFSPMRLRLSASRQAKTPAQSPRSMAARASANVSSGVVLAIGVPPFVGGSGNHRGALAVKIAEPCALVLRRLVPR